MGIIIKNITYDIKVAISKKHFEIYDDIWASVPEAISLCPATLQCTSIVDLNTNSEYTFELGIINSLDPVIISMIIC